jgi:hypothetical protein
MADVVSLWRNLARFWHTDPLGPTDHAEVATYPQVRGGVGGPSPPRNSGYALAVSKMSALVLASGMTRLPPSSLWAVRACPASLFHEAPE